jgi:predicted RecB family nuclease
MQKVKRTLLYSASDLTNFLDCRHLTTLDLKNLETPLPKADDDAQAKLIQEKGFQHEERYLDLLRSTGGRVVDLKSEMRDSEEAVRATIDAMTQGVEIIYQACLRSDPFFGYADFLRRVKRPSGLGRFSYEVVDTKLARSPRAKYLIQLCVYSRMIEKIQGVSPRSMHLVLGDGTERNFRVAEFFHYYRQVQSRFLKHVNGKFEETYPEMCAHCAQCYWRDICKDQWEKDDHLCRVANITRVQIDKLRVQGIKTMAKLAKLPQSQRVKGIQPSNVERLRSQAALQRHKQETGEDRFDILHVDPDGMRGFYRLPRPDPGDIFFDIEGDPLEEGGLDYLFGVYSFENGIPRYRPFWAHNSQEEQHAFRDLIAFVTQRLVKYPQAHIYHYASYEETALKRLMSLYGTCEAEVDQLLRTGKLVDLYKVVKESIRTSEPGYSIKNLEVFYAGKRQGELADGGTSIVYYEKWKQTGDSNFLEEIRSYNEVDCRSLYQLREWLLTFRPGDISWYGEHAQKQIESEKSVKVREHEERLEKYRSKLLSEFSSERILKEQEFNLCEIVFQLLDFHRRAAKPEWWNMFSRKEMDGEELLDDPECIACLEMTGHPRPVKRSFLYTYRFPDQEFKFKAGDSCLRADTLDRAGTIEELDEKDRLLCLKLGNKSSLPERLSIIPTGPISTNPLKEALFRFTDSLIAGNGRYRAILDLLRRERPRMKDIRQENAIVRPGQDLIKEIIDAANRLDRSYLFIQGPPGAGKTFTGSHLITALIKKGFRVGVSSNSHKAINNLLEAVEKRAQEEGFRFAGVKKSTFGDPDSFFNGRFIRDEKDKQAAICSRADMLAGTAWLFSDPDLDQTLDYLFVDEAGQVSLANLVAMATSAKNIILLGDQMQLQQPIRGIHPGHSGESALDYMLQGEATISEDRGVFLPVTWRMHEDICRFISDAVYDGRLRPAPRNENQKLLLGPNVHSALKETGIRFIPVHHEGCSQRSEAEAELVKEIYLNLLEQFYKDRENDQHRLQTKDILVVSPYNMQVNLLKQTLPEGARVGTVDKFQGQEAQVVIFSMATSSGEDLPRHMGFLFSKNRLNVALSRAKCLAILVANPKLLAINCNTVEQMGLVNTLCWVEAYSNA